MSIVAKYDNIVLGENEIMIYISHLIPDEEMKELVEKTGAGVESIDFSIAYNLDRLDETIKSYEKRLKYIGTDDLIIHGPFLDLNPMTFDDDIRKVTMKRYSQALEGAKALGAKKIVYHSCFYPDAYYLIGWAERMADFYLELMEEGQNQNVEVLMENVFDRKWEPFAEVTERVNRSDFGLCFDAGHANCYSHATAKEWADGLRNRINHIHVHDNSGDDDLHLAMGQGTVPWEYILSLFSHRNDVTYTIECGDRDRILTTFRQLDKILAKG